MTGSSSAPSDPRREPSSQRVAPGAGAPEAATGRSPLPPDPAEYDSPRSALARARGLSAPYIAGGRDPHPEKGLREERFYGRLLVLMVVTIVVAGFVLGILFNVVDTIWGG